MTTAEALRWVNLLAFVALLVAGVRLLERHSTRGYGAALVAWAINNIAFYAVVITDWPPLASGQLNQWSSVTKLQAVIMALGMAGIAWKRRR